MHLSDYDLKQLNEDGLHALPAERLRGLSVKLLADLKEARDRLNRNPKNSSQPPSTQAPWEKPALIKPEQDTSTSTTNQADADVADKNELQVESQVGKSDNIVKPDKLPKRPGRQPGTQGYSRTQQLPINAERNHIPEYCSVCGQPLHAMVERHAYTARYEIDVAPPGDGTHGLVVLQTKHTHMEVRHAMGFGISRNPGFCQRLAERGVIRDPPLGDFEYINNLALKVCKVIAFKARPHNHLN